MKKLLSLILSLALLLGCTAALGEDTEGKVPLGTLSINGAFTLQCGVPEGYTPTPILANSDIIVAVLKSEDPEKPQMYLTVAFDETYANVQRMNELDNDALDLLEQTYLVNDPNVEFTYGETGLGTQLLIASQTVNEPNYIDFLSIYKGYFVEFVLVPSEGASSKELTDEQKAMAIQFLTDLDFIEADEDAVRAQAEANSSKYIAEILSFDAATSTAVMTLKQPVRLTADYVAQALEQKAISINGEEIAVETAETLEDGTIIINDTYSLVPQESGTKYDARLVEDDAFILAEVMTGAALYITPDAVFLDEIDPETLETLDQPVTHTIAEFAAMLESEGTTAVGPGFASDNVTVTCDENFNVVLIDRYYTPWQ